MQNNDRWLADIKNVDKKFTTSDRAVGRARPADETGKRKKFKNVLDDKKKLGKKKEKDKEKKPLSPLAKQLNQVLASKDATSKLGKEVDAAEEKTAPTPFDVIQQQRNVEEIPEITPVAPKGSVIGSPQIDASSAKAPVSDVKEIIDQIIDKLYTLKMKGETETVVTIKHPPLFNGAKLTVTAYDSATGEFNIKFSELTPQAKQLLDMQTAQEALQKMLEQKGYTMHIFIATTGTEEKQAASSSQNFSEKERENEKKDKEQKEGKEQRG